MGFSDLEVGNDISDCACAVRRVVAKFDRKQNIMYNFLFGDQEGNSIAGVYFGALAVPPKQGDIVMVSGTVGQYNGLQIAVSGIKPADNIDDATLLSFIPRAPYTKGQLEQRTMMAIDAIKDAEIAGYVASRIDSTDGYYEAPAAMSVHQDCIGGLAWHQSGVAFIVMKVAPDYPMVNMDIAIAGALLHDIGKVREFTTRGTIAKSSEGIEIGHIGIGLQMLIEHASMRKIDPKVLQDLMHIILSHHGSAEYGSPVNPCTLEAELVHLADKMDAQMVALSEIIRRDPNEGEWAAYNRTLDRTMRKTADVADQQSLALESDKEEQQKLVMPF